MTLHAVQDGVRDEPWQDVVIRLEHEADQHTAQADQCRWQAARIISERLALGETQASVALAIGKSQTHVSRMSRVYTSALESPETKTSFNDRYQALASKTKDKDEPGAGPSEDRPEPRPKAEGPDADFVLAGEISDQIAKALDKLDRLGFDNVDKVNNLVVVELDRHRTHIDRILERIK